MNISLSEHFDYKKLLRFSMPTIAMLIFTSIYGVIDGLFVSNVVGSDAFASVNLIMPFVMVLGSLGFMIGTGGGALVSKILGEGDEKKANEVFSILTYFLIFMGVILTILGILFTEPIAKALGADEVTLSNCVIYGRVLLISLIPFFLNNSFQSFFVVAEKPMIGLAISIVAGIVNIVFDFLFVYVWQMEVFGAAVATGLSQLIGGGLPLIYFYRKNPTKLRLGKAPFDGKALWQSCINGSSEMLTNVSMSLVNMLYNLQLMKFVGADGVVAYGVIMYIFFIFTGMYNGYAIGTAPIISYHYGAQNTEELKSLYKKSLMLVGIGAIIMTLLAQLSSGMLAGIFVSYDPELVQMTTTAIQLFSLSYLLSGFNIFASSFFTALNNGGVSACISFLRTLVFQVITIFVLPIFFQVYGIWLAVVAAEFLALFVSIICFQRNRKKYAYA